MRKDIIKLIAAKTALLAKYADGRSCLPELAADIAITAPTASPVCIWTLNRATEKQTAAVLWILSAYGYEKTVNGQLSIAAEGAVT